MFEIRTGCRIHFGLVELAEGAPHRFGGLGLALDSPSCLLRFSKPSNIALRSGRKVCETQQRINCTQTLWRERNVGVELPQVEIDAIASLPSHSGLGSGTQLDVAAVAGLRLATRWQAVSSAVAAAGSWESVAKCLGWSLSTAATESARGKRSAIGLHSFLHGGLAMDFGSHAPAGCRREFNCTGSALPEAWRVVLVRPNVESRVSGPLEHNLLEQVAQRRNPESQRMCSIAQHIVAGACNGELGFSEFSDRLEQYMDLASRLFFEVQGGKFNGRCVTEAAEAAADCGLRGVGQSSWGPTVFGFAESPDSAEASAELIRSRLPSEDTDVSVAKPSSRGAVWRPWSPETR